MGGREGGGWGCGDDSVMELVGKYMGELVDRWISGLWMDW